MANLRPRLRGGFPQRGSFRAQSKEVEHANRCGRGATGEGGRDETRSVFLQTDRRTRHLTQHFIDRNSPTQRKNLPSASTRLLLGAASARRFCADPPITSATTTDWIGACQKFWGGFLYGESMRRLLSESQSGGQTCDIGHRTKISNPRGRSIAVYGNI